MSFINFVKFSKNKLDNTSSIIVIDRYNDDSKIDFIMSLFEKRQDSVHKQIIFINPPKNYIVRYSNHKVISLFIYENYVPENILELSYTKFLKNIIVINPLKKYPDFIYSIFGWVTPYFKVNRKVLTQEYLTKKSMSTSLTICDPIVVKNKHNINIPYNHIDDINIIDNKLCNTCKYNRICRFRVLKAYQEVYARCDDYIYHELVNYNRLKDSLPKLILEKDICSDDVKRYISNMYF